MKYASRIVGARRSAAVSLAFVLALAALPLIAGQALAAKPLPVVGAHGGDCVPPLAGRTEQHVGWFDLGPNKGRWIFVESQVRAGDASWSSYVASTPTRVETERFEMRRSGVGPDEDSGFRLRVMSRKGEPLTGWTEVLDVDC